MGLKQPQNSKFKLGWAQAKSTQSHLNSFVDFFGGLSDKSRTYSESERSQNFEEMGLLIKSFYAIL